MLLLARCVAPAAVSLFLRHQQLVAYGTGVELVANAALAWLAVVVAVAACIVVVFVAAGVFVTLDIVVFVPLALAESVALKRLVWAPTP